MSAQIQPNSFDCRTSSFTGGRSWPDWCLCACLSAVLFWQSIVIQTLRRFYGGARWQHEASSGDSGRQMRGDKEHFLNSVANYDRVWRNRRRLEARLGVRQRLWLVRTAGANQLTCMHFFSSPFSILFLHSYNNFNDQQTRELISARKKSHKHNNKDPSCLR